MSQLAKLNLKNFTPSPTHNVEEMRRQKLMKAVEEQLSVADAALRGDCHIRGWLGILRPRAGGRLVWTLRASAPR